MYDYLVLRDYDNFYLDFDRCDDISQATILRLVDRGLVVLKEEVRENRRGIPYRIVLVKVTTRHGVIKYVD